jgi:hypothetical protein
MLFLSHLFLDAFRVTQLGEHLRQTGGVRVFQVNIAIFNLHCEGRLFIAPIYKHSLYELRNEVV